MPWLGTQLLLEFYDCNPDVLNDKHRVLEILVADALGSDAQIDPDHFYTFSPHGLSGAIGLDGSLVAIHTWPEHGYAAVDVFMCGRTKPERCVDVLRNAFTPESIAVEEILRGRTR